jgi:hypothetical protein
MIKWRGWKGGEGKRKEGKGKDGKEGRGRKGRGGKGWDGVNPPPRKQILATALIARHCFMLICNFGFTLNISTRS